MGEFGEGQVVQHSLLETNGDWHMKRAIEHFKRVHLDGNKLLLVIVVNRDLQEIRVLRDHFPESCVLFCLFHVLKWFKHYSRKPEFGKIAADDHSALDHLVHNCVTLPVPTTTTIARGTLLAAQV